MVRKILSQLQDPRSIIFGFKIIFAYSIGSYWNGVDGKGRGKMLARLLEAGGGGVRLEFGCSMWKGMALMWGVVCLVQT